jgi:uncharacterized protein
VIPLGAVTGFADPYVRYALRFRPLAVPELAEDEPPEAEPGEAEQPDAAPQVVSLDAFRRRPPSKE